MPSPPSAPGSSPIGSAWPLCSPAGLWISAAAFTGYLAVSSFGLLLAARVLQGVGGGLIVYGTAPALITLALRGKRHGFGLGRLALGMGAGLALGPIIGGALVEASGWRAVFLSGALALAVGALSSLLLRAASAREVWRCAAARSGGADKCWAPCSSCRRCANWAQFAVWLPRALTTSWACWASPRRAGRSSSSRADSAGYRRHVAAGRPHRRPRGPAASHHARAGGGGRRALPHRPPRRVVVPTAWSARRSRWWAWASASSRCPISPR